MVQAKPQRRTDDPSLNKVIAGRYRLEARIGEGGSRLPTVVRQLVFRFRHGAVAARWAEALVAAHMAGGADQPLFVQSRFCLAGNRRRQAVGLFGQRRVAADAGQVFVARFGRHVDQLPEHARPHCPGVHCAAPVLVLLHMAVAASGRIERRFLRREVCRRGALRRQRALPVPVQKRRDIVCARHGGTSRSRRLRAGGEHGQKQNGEEA